MARKISEAARELALAIWAEQAANGIGSEIVNPDMLDEWLDNRTYPISVLEDAAAGDVEALFEVRVEAGLPPII